MRGNTARLGIEFRQRPRLGETGNMHDQRIEVWSSLGGENGGHRAVVGRIGTEAIYRFGRKRDQFPGVQQPSGLLDRGCAGGDGFGTHGSLSSATAGPATRDPAKPDGNSGIDICTAGNTLERY